LIIGHRGASSLAPENTLAAFSRALADGADGLELDVHLAQDGVPVVVHDASLRRTGLCRGVIAEMTSKELSQVDVGSWFNRRRPRFARKEYSGERVPTLAEVLRLVTQSAVTANDVTLYIELKGNGRSAVGRDLVEATIEIVQNCKLRAQVVIISFDLKLIALAKQIDPDIRTGALFAPKGRDSARIRRSRIALSAKDSGADEILLHRLLARRRMIELSRQSQLLPVVWTVKHIPWIRRARVWGIHALITNNPAKLKAALSQIVS
jgi:glycerophosphoryl diester phosphodiesterase